MKKRRIQLLEKAAERLDLPADVVARVTRVDITDDRSIYIENHRGLLEYGDNCIQVEGCGVVLKIQGAGLRIRAMTQNELNLSGRVDSVEFLREGV